MKKPLRALSVLTLALPFISQAQPPRFRVVPLPTLGGDPSVVGTETLGVSSRGVAVGVTNDFHGHSTPTAWMRGRVLALPNPTGSNGQAVAVNDTGVIVGTLFDSVGSQNRAVFWLGNRMHDLDSPRFPNCWANGINEAGVIVGEGISADGKAGSAIVWEHGHPHALPALPGDRYCGAKAINDHGTIGGWSSLNGAFRPALWHEGVPRALPFPPAAENCLVTYINQQGDAVGYWLMGSPIHIGTLLWVDGVMTELPLLDPTAPFMAQMPSGINRRRQIVGSSPVSHSGGGFLYQDGQMYRLEDLVESGSPYRVEVAQSINDEGWITAYAYSAAGEIAVVLIPDR